jgi:hypothetical protein
MKQDITTMAGYGQQKECARECMVDETSWCPEDPLGKAIGCSEMNQCDNFALNDCYCRQDLQQPAIKYINSCVSRKCTVGNNALDASTAVGYYSNYCKGKGYAEPTVQVVPTSTGARATQTGAGAGASQKGTLNPALAEPTGSSTSGDTSSSSSGSSSGKLGIASIVGIVAGAIAALLFALIGIKVVVGWVKRSRARKRQEMAYTQQLPPPTYQPPIYPMDMLAAKPYHAAPESELGPEDSMSMIGHRPAPTILSAAPMPGMTTPYGQQFGR